MEGKKIDFSKFIKPHWTEHEKNNYRIIGEFMQGILNNEFDEVIEKYNGHPYIQHTSMVDNGIEAIVKINKRNIKRFPDFFQEPKHVYLDGDFVIIHSHVTVKAKHRGNDRKGLNVFDTWKVLDGKIVEHWATIAPLDFISRLILTFSTSFGKKNQDGEF